MMRKKSFHQTAWLANLIKSYIKRVIRDGNWVSIHNITNFAPYDKCTLTISLAN